MNTRTVLVGLTMLFFFVILPIIGFMSSKLGLDFNKTVKSELPIQGKFPAFKAMQQIGDSISQEALNIKVGYIQFIPADCGEDCKRNLKLFNEIVGEFTRRDEERLSILTFVYGDSLLSAQKLEELAKPYRTNDRKVKWYFLAMHRAEAFQKEVFKQNEHGTQGQNICLIDMFGNIRGHYDISDTKEISNLLRHTVILFSPKEKIKKIKEHE